MRAPIALALIAALAAAVLASPGRAPAATGRVLVVGDSLVVGTTPYLRRELSGASVTSDGRVGRPSGEAVGVLRQRFSGSERVVVFDAGVNDDPGQPGRLASDLAAARSIVGGRCLVVATVSRPPYRGISVRGLNSAVRRFAAGSSNVQLVDWRAFAVANPGLIARDGVHPTPSGYAARARLFAEAIDSCGGSSRSGGGRPPSSSLPAPDTSEPPSDALPPARRPGRRRPAPPKPPAPPPELGNAQVFGVQPVSFVSAGARLRGELLVPSSRGRHPAVVMIHGTGPGTRLPFREQAEFLAEHGIATLIYDKRGSGQSTGNPDYSYDELASDVSAAVALLRDEPDVRRDAIGLWGLSEGGWIAPLVASRDPAIRAVMVVSPSALAPATQQDWATRNALSSSGAGSGTHVVTTYYRVAADAGRSGFADGLGARRDDDLGFDPAPSWRRVAQPVLAVWGADDRVVPARASAAALATDLAASPNRDRTFRTFPGASHVLGVAAKGGRPGSAPGFMELSARWLRDRLTGRPAARASVAPLPPPSGTPVVQAQNASLLEHWPAQLAWLLLPAVALAVLLARTLIRRRRLGEGWPRPAEWWPLAGVVALDLAAIAALGIAVASIVTVDGEGVQAIAGVPTVVWVAWGIALAALGATVALARWARGRARRDESSARPATAVCLASAAWLLLIVYWLV